MADSEPIVLHTQIGKNKYVITIRCHPNPERKAEFDRLWATFILRHLVEDELSTDQTEKE